MHYTRRSLMNIYEYASAHERLLEQMPNYVALSTPDHRFAFSSNKTARIMGFKSSDNIKNISFSNVNCKAAEDAVFFEKENNLVFNQLKKISTLGYHHYFNDWTLVLCEKSPLVNNNGKPIGIFMYFIDITNHNLIDYSRFILGNEFYPSKRKSFSYLIEDGTLNHYGLSERQIECLFLLLRGKSDKDTARILGLSPRTVESYINEIKFKMDCSTRSQIIEKSFHEGLFNVLPRNFIK